MLNMKTLKNSLMWPVLATVFLVGCTQYTGAVKERGVQAADQHYKTSIFAYCRTQMSGKLLRMSKQERDAFVRYCQEYGVQ